MNSQDVDITGVSSSESKALCKYFLTSSCTKGDKCVFSHDLSTLEKYSGTTICRFYARGACKNGQRCYFIHEQPEVIVKSNNNVCLYHFQENSESGMGCVCHKKKRKREMCNYFLLGFCYYGSDCRFKHSSSKPVCSFYSLGTCRFGDLCRNAHFKLSQNSTEENCNGSVSPKKNIDTAKISIPSELDQKQTKIYGTTSSSSTQEYSNLESTTNPIESSEKFGSVTKQNNVKKNSTSSELDVNQMTMNGTTSSSSTQEPSNSESSEKIVNVTKQKNKNITKSSISSELYQKQMMVDGATSSSSIRESIVNRNRRYVRGSHLKKSFL